MKSLVKGFLVSGAVLALVSCSAVSNTVNSIAPELEIGNHHQDNMVKNELPHVLSAAKYKTSAWFATDKSDLNAAGRASLDKIAANYQQLVANGTISQGTSMTVVGHTDSRASVGYNQKLSERRAESVASYLRSRGIQTAVTRGASELEPIASNRTRQGMQKNRRAEIHINGNYIRVVAW